jgi:hypothetical protein
VRLTRLSLPQRAPRRVSPQHGAVEHRALNTPGELLMRLQGQRSNTGVKLLLLLVVVIAVAAVFYFLYLAPR